MNEHTLKALHDAHAVMLAARTYHGVTLTSYPPQDAWVFHRVGERLGEAAQQIEALLMHEELHRKHRSMALRTMLLWSNPSLTMGMLDLIEAVATGQREMTHPEVAAVIERERGLSQIEFGRPQGFSNTGTRKCKVCLRDDFKTDLEALHHQCDWIGVVSHAAG